MNKLPLLPLFAMLLFAQDPKKPFTGRWDFTVTTDSRTYPQWMEVAENAGAPQIRIQPRGGAVRPAIAAKVEAGHLLITVSAASATQPEVKWDLTASGGELIGVQKSGDAVSAQLSGVRAPELKRANPAAWTTPEPLDRSIWQHLICSRSGLKIPYRRICSAVLAEFQRNRA